MATPEPKELVFADAAVEDLELIFAISILEWGDDHFYRFREELITSIRRLLEQPELGRERNDLSPGLRTLYVEPHEVAYMVSDKAVEVVRVLHQRRDLRRIRW